MHTQGVKEVFVLETQSNQPLEERLRGYQEGVSVLDPLITKLEKQNRWKYQIHRYSFVGGLCLLLVSRGFEHVRGVLQNLGSVNVT